jgi:hypothetical protein
MAKQPTVNKPIAVAPAKTMAVAPAKKEVVSSRLPAGYDQLKLTSDQRNKAVAIMDKYAGQIRDMESRLNALKVSQEKELAALLIVQPQSQVTKVKAVSPAKPSIKVVPTPSPATTAKANSQVNKEKTGKRDNVMASTLSISKDKLAKKSPGQK